MADPRQSWTRARIKVPSQHVAVRPWAAAGPGWANAGVYLREPLDREETCIYTDQLGPRAGVLFSVALAAINALESAIRTEGYRKERP